MAGETESGTPAVKAAPNRAALLWAMRIVPALLLLGFILLNRDTVAIRFLLWEVRTSLIWALVTSAVLGFVLGYFARRMRK